MWRRKARRRGEDETKTTAQAFAKAATVPLARVNATPKRQVGAEPPVLPLTMGDVKVQQRRRPVSPPASARTAAAVVRVTATMKRHTQPGTHNVVASGLASPRHATPPRLSRSKLDCTPPRMQRRPVSPPLFTRAVSSTRTAQAAANALNRTPPRSVTETRKAAAKPLNPTPPRPVSPTLLTTQTAQGAANADRTRSASGTAGRLPPRHARQSRTISMSL